MKSGDKNSHNMTVAVIGENAAAAYLESLGYTIAARNFRSGRGEVDIIAWQGNQLLVFVEVKARAGEGFGGPEESITARKQKMLVRTAGAYMESVGYEWAVRFDVIALIVQNGRIIDLRHHEDAFFL